jgi:glutamate synthase domain-containing protein 3
MSAKNITINGTPGNALGAYLDGGTIEVNGNAQDATADTMNDGTIIIHGSTGDTLGYAMRGGAVYVRGSAGYRTGIHMKEYKDKKPVIIIGGSVGSFLGEYLAGGLIVVLGIDAQEISSSLRDDVRLTSPLTRLKSEIPVGNFPGTGMHGGKIFIRTDKELQNLPAQVTAAPASAADLQEIAPYISEFARHFNMDSQRLMKDRFYVLKPNAHNPYQQLYTAN